MKVYYDKDADLGVIRKKKVAVVGYGSQGHAHANNLRESGLDIMVAEIKGPNWEKAKNAKPSEVEQQVMLTEYEDTN